MEGFVLATSLLLMTGLVAANVAVRAFTGQSLPATGEICQFLVLLLTAVGLSNAAGNGRHVRMSALHEQLSPCTRRRLLLVVSVSTAALLGALAIYGAHYVMIVQRLGSLSPVLRVPLWIPYCCVPVGFAMAALQYGFAAWKNLKSDEPHLAFDTPDGAAEDGEATP